MRKCKGIKICIICEGYEEQEHMEVLKKKNVFSDIYDFVIINAKSFNTIFNRYQEKFQSDSYTLVLIYCDTDKEKKGPSEKYLELKEKINLFHDEDVADDIIIFGNPCTMQIILSHFGKVKLTSQSKAINAKYIEELTGISGYKATEEQRKALFGKIRRDNYDKMKENLKEISTNDADIPSTNILKFLELFECDNPSWIDEINDKL